jgi:hypothetical protein
MKTRMVILALLLLALTCPSGVLADSWSGHYDVGVTVSPLGGNSYNFAYAVTNLDQGVAPHEGLDGFYVQVPLTATISNITDPPIYGTGSAWWGHSLEFNKPSVGGDHAVLQPGYQWLAWWGYNEPSLYPSGTKVSFSFDASNVAVGQHQGITVSYFLPYPTYIGYEDVIQGPATVPLPSALALLGSGLLGLGVFGRRRIFKR